MILGYYLGLDLVAIPLFFFILSLLPSKMRISALKGSMAKVSWEWYFVRGRSVVLSGFKGNSPLLFFAASDISPLQLQWSASRGHLQETMFCVLVLSSRAEVICKACHCDGASIDWHQLTYVRHGMQAIYPGMAYGVICSDEQFEQRSHFLRFSWQYLLCLLGHLQEKRPNPTFSSEGVFILRLQIGIKPRDAPGMEAPLALGVESQLSHGPQSRSLLTTLLTSSCPTLCLFSTPKLLLTYDFGLLRSLMALCPLRVLFQLPYLTRPAYFLVKIFKDGMWLVQIITLYQGQWSNPLLGQSLVAGGGVLHIQIPPCMLQWPAETGPVTDVSSLGQIFPWDRGKYKNCKSSLPTRGLWLNILINELQTHW